jgi:ribokinase
LPASRTRASIDVVVVGSANLDVVATTARLPVPGETVLGGSYAEHPGGKGLNQAVAAARAGAAVAFVGAVGADDAGRTLLGVLDAEVIDRSAVLVSSTRPTGRAVIVVDDGGENTIVVVPGANAEVVDADVGQARVLLVQLEIPLTTVAAALRRARLSGAMTILNPAPAVALDRESLGLVDVIVPNEHEAASLGGVEGLLAGGVGAVVTTRGSDGVEVATVHGRARVPAFDVASVDATGAGDAFCGVLAARLAAGDSLDAAVRVAAAAGALATTVAGAVPSMPEIAAIERLINAEGGSQPTLRG